MSIIAIIFKTGIGKKISGFYRFFNFIMLSFFLLETYFSIIPYKVFNIIYSGLFKKKGENMSKLFVMVLGCLLLCSSTVSAFSWNPIKDVESFAKSAVNADWVSDGTGKLYLTTHLNEKDGYSLVALLMVGEIKRASVEGFELPASNIKRRFKYVPLVMDTSFTSKRMRGYSAVQLFTFKLKKAKYSTAAEIMSMGFDKTAKVKTYCQVYLKKNGVITHWVTERIPVSDVNNKNHYYLVDPQKKVTEFFGHY